MAHFAELDENNIVLRVIVVANSDTANDEGAEVESIGVTFCKNLLGGRWVQTSYNNTFRKNLAGINYTYDSNRDAFIPPKPYASWLLNEESCQWTSPMAYPIDGKIYQWDEPTTSWVEAVN